MINDQSLTTDISPTSESAPEPEPVLPWTTPATLARGAAAAALAVFALWRITIGAALTDDGHVVVLALRMARGAVPLSDEMNFQALGSVWAVPFVWLWDQTVGLSGLVLFSRVLFLLMAAGVLALVHRALRGSFSFAVLLAAAALPLLAPPYGILTISYNTAPMLGLVLATAAGWAAWRDASGRWAVVTGVALAVAAFSAPSTAPAVAWFALAFVVLRPDRRTALPLLATLGGLGALTLLWVTVVPGWDAVAQTLVLSRDAVGIDGNSLSRLTRVLASYRLQLTDVSPAPGLYSYLPALVLTAAATVLGVLPPRRRLEPLPSLVLGAVPFAVLVPALLGALHPDRRLAIGSLGALQVVWLVLLMALPVLVHALTARRWDLVRLLLLTVPGGLVSGAAIALLTSSGPWWGAPVSGLAAAATAVLLAWAALLDDALRGAGRWLLAGLLPVMCVVLALVPFRDPYPWQLTARVHDGAYWGIATTTATATRFARTMTASRDWVGLGDDVLVYGLAGAYLLLDAEPLTNLTWLGPRGPGNAATVSYLDGRGSWPDVVLVDAATLADIGGLTGAADADPFLARTLQDYQVLTEDPRAGFFVLRRR